MYERINQKLTDNGNVDIMRRFKQRIELLYVFSFFLYKPEKIIQPVGIRKSADWEHILERLGSLEDKRIPPFDLRFSAWLSFLERRG